MAASGKIPLATDLEQRLGAAKPFLIPLTRQGLMDGGSSSLSRLLTVECHGTSIASFILVFFAEDPEQLVAGRERRLVGWN
jgi:hypothetical protein